MTVYVDALVHYGKSPNWPYDSACHMIADTVEELHEIADRIGLQRRWFQSQASAPHYDLTPGKRAEALRRGAVDGTLKEHRDLLNDCRKWWFAVKKLKRKRENHNG